MLKFFREMTTLNWGASILWIIFLLSLLGIIFKENQKQKKIVLGYYPIVVLLVIYNPIMYWVSDYFINTMDAGYCRWFLTMPIFICISYYLVIITRNLSELQKRLLFWGVVVCLCICGRYYY